MSFNSEEFAWKDIQLEVADRLVTGATEVKYGVERTVTDIYAAGSNPHSRTKGNKVREGTLKLLQSEVEALEDRAIELFGDEADITDLTFNATVSYAKVEGGTISTDKLINVDVTGYEKGMAQDDPNADIELPIMIGTIKRRR